MSRYTSGWTWLDEATDEQRDCPHNTAACERLYAEISLAYESIPDRSDEHYLESVDMAREDAYERALDAGGEEAADAAVVAFDAARANKGRAAWGNIEAVEELLRARGARLKREYEDWNEDEQRVRLAESGSSHDDRD